MFCKTCWTNLPDDTEQCSKCGLDPRVEGGGVEKDSEPKGDPLPTWLGNSSMSEPSGKPSETGPRCPVKRIKLDPNVKPSTKDPIVRFVVAIAIVLIIAGGVYHYQTTSKELKVQKSASPVVMVSAKAQKKSAYSAKPLIRLASSGVSVELVVEGSRGAEDFAAGVAAFKAKDYRDAAFYFKEAYKTIPADDDGLETIKVNIARSLTALGWESFGEKRFQSAKDFFEEAGDFYMEASSLKGFAYSQASLEEYDGAIDSLDILLSDFGPDIDAKMTLKLVYIKQAERMLAGNNTDESVRLIEQASELDPSDAALASRLEAAREESSYEEGFSERRGTRFNVKFEGGENAVSGHVIAILLEEAYQTIGAKLSYYPDTPISAVLYSGESFRDVTRSPSWAGALYDGRIKIPAGGITDSTRELEAVLFHEYTHALVHRLSGGRAPTWLNEGLAQYFEDKREAKYKSVLGEVAQGGGIDLSRLEGSFMNLDSKGAAVAYAVSLSATEYIIREYGVYACKRILESVGSGKSLRASIDATLFISYETLQDDWRRYLKREFGG
jgi:tetratricopeptide (TPR) repeat protein